MRWDWETPATEAEAEALQERIWDLHDKLSHAILALSACAGLPACRCRGAPNGHVVVKGLRPPQGGGHVDLAAAAAAMADARGLHAIRAALEDLEGHLHFLRDVQLQQRADQDAAVARVQQSRILLAARLAEHRGKGHGVIEEALGFVGDVRDKSQFVSPEDVYGTHSQSAEDEEDRRGHGSNMVVRVVSCSFALAKNILRFERMGSVLGNATVFAVSMLTFLQLHQLASGRQTAAVQYRTDNVSHSGGSRKDSKGKHLEVLLARG